MWVGKKSSVDKGAYAAIRAIQLNQFLNNKATQYRVVSQKNPRNFSHINFFYFLKIFR